MAFKRKEEVKEEKVEKKEVPYQPTKTHVDSPKDNPVNKAGKTPIKPAY